MIAQCIENGKDRLAEKEKARYTQTQADSQGKQAQQGLSIEKD